MGRQFVFSMQEADLEWRQEKLAREQARGLYPFDGSDILVEMEELHERVAGVENERVVEVVQLSKSVMEISDSLVGPGLSPIRDIPVYLTLAQDVLTAASLILEHLREEHASGADPWV
jgi:hypothetical protein